MSKDIFQKGIDYWHERLSMLSDKREEKNSFIKIRDIGLSAFSIFLRNQLPLTPRPRTPRGSQ